MAEMSEHDAYLCGWIDAIMLNACHDAELANIPDGVQTAIVRKGWMAPNGAKEWDGSGFLRLTPLGERTVQALTAKLGAYSDG